MVVRKQCGEQLCSFELDFLLFDLQDTSDFPSLFTASGTRIWLQAIYFWQSLPTCGSWVRFEGLDLCPTKVILLATNPLSIRIINQGKTLFEYLRIHPHPAIFAAA